MAKTWRIEIRDSLRVSPETARNAAKAILERFVSPEYELPQASNKRYQAGGSECGLFASSWVERSIREQHGEGRLPPTSEKDQIDRANRFIQKLKEAKRCKAQSKCQWGRPSPSQGRIQNLSGQAS